MDATPGRRSAARLRGARGLWFGYRPQHWAWALYDWSSSAFAMLVAVVSFPVFLHQVLLGSGPVLLRLGPLRVEIARQAIWPYAVAFGTLATTVAMVPLALWSDRAARRREVFAGLFAIGCLFTLAMAALPGGALAAGIAVYTVAEFGYSGSFVYYNAFLPMISRPRERDRVSSLGIAVGYTAGVALLVIGGLLLAWGGAGGVDLGLRATFLFAGGWWTLFSVPLLRNLPEEPPARAGMPSAWEEARVALRQVLADPDTTWFVVSMLAGSQGMLTILSQVAPYALFATGASPQQLAWALVLSQAAGGAGAFLFLRLAERAGSRRALMATLALWAGITLWGYFLRSLEELYILAILAGLGLGGNLALSRSYFTRYFTVEQATLWFTLSLFSTRFGALLGPAVYGLVVQWTGSLRLSVLSVAVFFIIGLLALGRVREASSRDRFSPASRSEGGRPAAPAPGGRR